MVARSFYGVDCLNSIPKWLRRGRKKLRGSAAGFLSRGSAKIWRRREMISRCFRTRQGQRPRYRSGNHPRAYGWGRFEATRRSCYGTETIPSLASAGSVIYRRCIHIQTVQMPEFPLSQQTRLIISDYITPWPSEHGVAAVTPRRRRALRGRRLGSRRMDEIRSRTARIPSAALPPRHISFCCLCNPPRRRNMF